MAASVSSLRVTLNAFIDSSSCGTLVAPMMTLPAAVMHGRLFALRAAPLRSQHTRV